MSLTLGLAAVGLGSKIYAGIKGAQANQEAEDQLDQQFEENEAFFNNNANRDFLETNAAKGVSEMLRKRMQDQVKTIDSKAEATGATDESKIAAKSDANEQYNEGINRIGQNATAYQLSSERDYRANLSNLYHQRMALNRSKAQNAANVSEAGGQLLSTAGSLGAMGEGADLDALADAQGKVADSKDRVKNFEQSWIAALD
jgi:hypothetical protein